MMRPITTSCYNCKVQSICKPFEVFEQLSAPLNLIDVTHDVTIYDQIINLIASGCVFFVKEKDEVA